MTQNVGIISGDVIATTYNYPSAPAAGGTDSTLDQNGVFWGWLNVSCYAELDIDIVVTFTGGATPTVTLHVQRGLGNDSGLVVPTPGSSLKTQVTSGSPSPNAFSIGTNLANPTGVGRFIRVTWDTVVGAPTAMSIAISIVGKAA